MSYIPKRLHEIPDPPKHLWISGEMPNEDFLYLTVIGARNHTSYGKDVCEYLVSSLAGESVVIVSGLALGIDSIAHKTALKYDIKTISLPGSGLDESALYPRAHVYLARSIVDAGGCCLSECEPYERSHPFMFPRRNRLMAGIADAVLVIECKEKSGTRITAGLATQYNRDVLSVPGSIFSPQSRGTHALLREGATPIANAEDLFEALKLERNIKNDSIKNLLLSEQEEKLYNMLSEPQARSDLMFKMKLPHAEFYTLLSQLEIRCIIREHLGLIERAPRYL